MDPGPERIAYALEALPPGATLRSVSADPSDARGRPALRISLTEAVRRDGKPGVDFVDQPTFVILPLDVAAARLEVDISSDLLPEAPDLARGFAGLAFAIAPDCSTFEAVYVRPCNGLSMAPDEVRRQRAVQYFAYPGWPQLTRRPGMAPLRRLAMHAPGPRQPQTNQRNAPLEG